MAGIFKFSKVGVHNLINPTKISLNSNFLLFIHIYRRFIDTLPILWYFGPKLILWLHMRAQIFKFSKFGLHNIIHPTKISLNAKFHLFIQIPRRIIDTLPILRYFLGLNWSCDVTGRPEFSKFQLLDFIIEFSLPKLI